MVPHLTLPLSLCLTLWLCLVYLNLVKGMVMQHCLTGLSNWPQSSGSIYCSRNVWGTMIERECVTIYVTFSHSVPTDIDLLHWTFSTQASHQTKAERSFHWNRLESDMHVHSLQSTHTCQGLSKTQWTHIFTYIHHFRHISYTHALSLPKTMATHTRMHNEAINQTWLTLSPPSSFLSCRLVQESSEQGNNNLLINGFSVRPHPF